MKLRKILDEAISGKDMDRLTNFLKRAMNGKVKEQGMISAGFNLKNPAGNNEENIAKSLANSMNMKITKEDLMNALKEVGVKSVSQIVQGWNKAQGGQQTRTAGTRKEGSKTQQF